MAYAIKAAVGDAGAKAFSFRAQKTMYGGKEIAEGDTIYIFASENEGGHGLIAKGVVTAVDYSRVKKPEVSSPVYGGSVVAACRWPQSGGGAFAIPRA